MLKIERQPEHPLCRSQLTLAARVARKEKLPRFSNLAARAPLEGYDNSPIQLFCIFARDQFSFGAAVCRYQLPSSYLSWKGAILRNVPRWIFDPRQRILAQN